MGCSSFLELWCYKYAKFVEMFINRLFMGKNHYTMHGSNQGLVNFASFILIILPVACYLYQELWRELCAFTAFCFLVAFCASPWGWKRPHPYSDNPLNKPKGS